VKPHCGPTNIRLRVHISIAVPHGATICVGNETRRWSDSDVLVFDDSFEHEVRNDSPDPRLVFIFDIWHQSLRTDEQRLAALDAVAKARYQRTVASLRAGMGLPMEDDLVADRRRRTIY